MSHRNTKHLKTVVNIELEKVAHWLDGNQLTLNFSKTNYMLMGQQKGKFETTINSKTINQENNVGHIGVILDDKLNWKRLFHQKFRLLKFENRDLRNRKHSLTVPYYESHTTGTENDYATTIFQTSVTGIFGEIDTSN